MEESLASAKTAIKDRLPGLNMYQHIYNESHELDMRLQARIVSAYQGFIEFCMEALKYYKGTGPRKCCSQVAASKQHLIVTSDDSHHREVAESTGKAQQHSRQGKGGPRYNNGYTATMR